MKSGDASLRVECKACGATFKMTVRGAELKVERAPCPRCDAPLDLKSQWDAHKASLKGASVPMAGVITRKRNTTPKVLEAESKKPGGLGFHIKQQAGRDIVSTPIQKSPIDSSALGRLSPNLDKSRNDSRKWIDPDESAELPAVAGGQEKPQKRTMPLPTVDKAPRAEDEDSQKRTIPIPTVDEAPPEQEDEDSQKRTMPMPSVKKTLPLRTVEGPEETKVSKKIPTLSIPRPASKPSPIEPDDDPTVQHDIESLLSELNSEVFGSIEVVEDDFAAFVEEDETEQISATEHEQLLEAAGEGKERQGTDEWDLAAIDSVTMLEPVYAGEIEPEPGDIADTVRDRPGVLDTLRDPSPGEPDAARADVQPETPVSVEGTLEPGYQFDSDEDNEDWAWREEADAVDFDDEPPAAQRKSSALGLVVALLFCALAVIALVVFFS